MNHSVVHLPVFPCQQCGLCCQRVHLAAETKSLDRGDGVCMHYEETNKVCTIYDERPDICRVDALYKKRYVQLYTWEEYVDLNLQVCKRLHNEME